jgi:Cu+-exporting ATPase
MASAKDPVCGMTVDTERAAGSAQYEGTTYYFCSSGCRASFVEDPKKYLS